VKKYLLSRFLVIALIVMLSLYWNSGFRAHAVVEDDILRLIVEKNKADIDRVAQDYN
jgi:hypothetical protein